MKKYALTADSFKGVVYVTYDKDEAQTLICLDATEADLAFNQLNYLFRKMPIMLTQLQPFLDQAKLKAVEVLKEVTFDDFYQAYGNKEGRKKAEAAWSKMPKAEQLKAFYYIPRLKTKKQISGEALPYPATYLNQARWND